MGDLPASELVSAPCEPITPIREKTIPFHIPGEINRPGDIWVVLKAIHHIVPTGDYLLDAECDVKRAGSPAWQPTISYCWSFEDPDPWSSSLRI
jgi:hypothetical protein